MNKTFTLLTAIAGIAIAAPVFADDIQDDRQDIQSDISAIHKDNIALNKDRNTLARDRAAKAADKANDNTGKQMADSTRIGAVETAISEKKAERNVDREQLAHDQKELKKDTLKAESAQQ